MSVFETKNDKCGFHKQFAVDINGNNTEFVFHEFENKWMLLITQLGKLPAFYNVAFDVKRDHRVLPFTHGPVDDPEFHVSVPVTMTCCMGVDSDEIRGGIQFLINKTAINKCPSELLIALGLKKIESEDLRAIAKVLENGIF
ncbi:uncharacterized protein LOC6577711 [Drosophila mojavensis]|uniref:Uncharacterized protein n=1 Tax=Drosophila mojavensis TaxID=7230 RepID=B4KFI8_DROMO|nr:uncharacterized protein LOC6577711 [Drosophila mojavensis]EDW13103.1 uncharacterized protein Dmoj_GI18035 [Drosophila mojavensis]